jgi:arylsulfatase A
MTAHMKTIFIIALLLVTSTLLADKPNIVYILADDLGYGDIHCQNPDSKIPTPHIDRLAREGIRFTDLHSNSSVCSPTRYGIMTGRYSFRTWLQRGALSGYQKPLIAENRMTVASLLKEQGYTTACIGKWHMGWNWTEGEKGVDFTQPFTGGPVDVGFDSFFGICASLDIPPYCYCRGNKASRLPTLKVKAGVFGGRPGLADPDLRPEQAMLDFNTEVRSFIKNHAASEKDTPFFLYYPLPAPHVPVKPAKQFQGKTPVGAYGDYVYEVDWMVGQVLEALEQAGLDHNTLVMFSADNGASPTASGSAVRKGHKPNKPFRGGKASLWDGGHRVPFMARWPARIKSGLVNDELFCTTDLMATCAEIVGVALPDTAGEDSISLLSAMDDRATPSTRDAIIHHSVYGSFSVRTPKWKYILTTGSGGWNHTLGMPRIPENKTLDGQLYDMRSDVYEERNLAASHPERISQLKDLLRHLVEQGRSTPGVPQPNDAKITIK